MNILDKHLKKSRSLAREILKSSFIKSSGVIITHRIELRNIRSVVVTEIELVGTRFYKKGQSKIIDDNKLLKEFEEAKEYD